MGKADPGIEVELEWKGQKLDFKMKPVTLEVEDELDECSREIQRVNENSDSRPIDRTQAIAAQLDVLLVPLPRPAGDTGGESTPTKPTDILLPAYEAGEVTGMQIRKLVDDMVTQARPT
jgi:hypothetical protein